MPPRALPTMFVSRTYDHAVIGNYLKKKHPVLSKLIGKQETTQLFISKKDIEELISKFEFLGAKILQMYFASYCATGFAPVDEIVFAGYDKMLTIIFAATDNDGNDLGQYYIVNPNGDLV